MKRGGEGRQGMSMLKEERKAWPGVLALGRGVVAGRHYRSGCARYGILDASKVGHDGVVGGEQGYGCETRLR